MLKGVLFVGLGAISYGVLATVVKLSYNEGFNTEEVTFSQFGIGWLILAVMAIVQLRNQTAVCDKELTVKHKQAIFKLILAGTSLGFTGLFYYRAVHFVPVSLCIVLLMQSVWMGVLLEVILLRKRPSITKIIAVGIVLVGTVFATEVYKDINVLDFRGVIWGMLGALAYTVSLFTSNKIGLELHNIFRSFWMMTGGFLVVVFAALPVLFQSFSWDVFLPWGLFLAIFGTVLPPLFMNKGMPLTGMGIGAIIIAIEIPVSVAMASIFLQEHINWIQWCGVVLIMCAIVLLNLKKKA